MENTTTTEATARTFEAVDLKPGDRITFNFRGATNKLGDVEIFDAYPVAGNQVQLVMLDRHGEYIHRKVAGFTRFALKEA